MPANILLSPTLKTGNPQGESSYASGNDNASSRTRCPYDMCCIFTVWQGIAWGTQLAVSNSKEETMSQRIRDIMTSNPCTIDADRSVAYAAKMMREEDVGVAPIVEGEKLIGMLTDRDIAVRIAAEGRDPDQVKVRDVATRRLVTIHPQQDLDEALRIMAKHQVRRLPVVEEDGRLVGVVAQADIAREGDDSKTGQLVEEISESGGQMSSFEEGQQFGAPIEGPQVVEPIIQHEEPQLPEEESISRVSA